ncbi:MAG TPA: FHA domain-containing protein, partial [Woeseiaceae bacterium]|nr:FHA domain-containing protein [Woeseiaceae bacterium]
KTEQDEFEKTMVIPTGQQNADQLAEAERLADKAVAAAVEQGIVHDDVAESVKLDPEEAAALEDDAPPTPKKEEMAEPVKEETAEPVAHSATMTGIDPAMAPNALPLAKLQVLSGAFAGRELELTKALTTLGRPGVQVAAITRRAEGYYIVHVESGKEGDFPLVNGQPIGPQARKLTDNDVVQLAGVKMGFFAA